MLLSARGWQHRAERDRLFFISAASCHAGGVKGAISLLLFPDVVLRDGEMLTLFFFGI